MGRTELLQQCLAFECRWPSLMSRLSSTPTAPTRAGSSSTRFCARTTFPGTRRRGEMRLSSARRFHRSLIPARMRQSPEGRLEAPPASLRHSAATMPKSEPILTRRELDGQARGHQGQKRRGRVRLFRPRPDVRRAGHAHECKDVERLSLISSSLCQRSNRRESPWSQRAAWSKRVLELGHDGGDVSYTRRDGSGCGSMSSSCRRCEQ